MKPKYFAKPNVRPSDKSLIPVYCAWCKKHMKGPKGDYNKASHGACFDCLYKQLIEIGLTHDEAIAQIEKPEWVKEAARYAADTKTHE